MPKLNVMNRSLRKMIIYIADVVLNKSVKSEKCIKTLNLTHGRLYMSGVLETGIRKSFFQQRTICIDRRNRFFFSLLF